MNISKFERSTFIEAGRETVFAFCNSSQGFRQIFPYRVQWESGPDDWQYGDQIAFRFRYGGVWIPYLAQIVAWEPNCFFVDEMVRGPYRFFRHAHYFFAEANGTTLVDRIEFNTGYGRLVDRTFGRWMLNSLFQQRHARLKLALELPQK
jgi:ligand-binding SRPBCC domain-containing protein